MLLKKGLSLVLAVSLVILIGLPCFSSIGAAEPVGFDEIEFSGQGPAGVELVKTNANKITFEFLNVEHEERYTVTQSVENRKMQIVVTNTAPKYGVNVQFGPDEYRNVIRVHIPNEVYKQFNITANEMVIQINDFNAPVQATGERGGIYLKDDSIVMGTYNISVSSGPVSIESAFINTDIKVNVENGPVTLHFHEQPKNLYLDTTSCGPIVKRPDTWAAEYKVGNETPEIIIVNTKGLTTIKVE
ncbi:hypothetical protein LJC63_12790 [Ruminococcaceae bacterium OttesenSCG-928-L11]|nr:hypothetical protein [Ruminococcaceae bacterium OttesenSCG-928-L11]